MGPSYACNECNGLMGPLIEACTVALTPLAHLRYADRAQGDINLLLFSISGMGVDPGRSFAVLQFCIVRLLNDTDAAPAMTVARP